MWTEPGTYRAYDEHVKSLQNKDIEITEEKCTGGPRDSYLLRTAKYQTTFGLPMVAKEYIESDIGGAVVVKLDVRLDPSAATA